MRITYAKRRTFVTRDTTYTTYKCVSHNNAPVNSSCAHPPPGQLRGICTHCQSRGSGISLPKGYPRAFDTRGFWLEIQTKTILSEKTSSLSLIGLSVKDWTKLWRFLKVCFLDFRHFLSYNTETWPRKIVVIMYFTFKTYPGGGAFALFFHPHPREFATQNKKSANARGLARGGDGRSWNWLMHKAGRFHFSFWHVLFIFIIELKTSLEQVNEDFTLSLAWLQCIKPKWKHLSATYAVLWHPACRVVLSNELSRFFSCKFSWSWRRKYIRKPNFSEWKQFSEAVSFFPTG